jgi:hypothetical protein
VNPYLTFSIRNFEYSAKAFKIKQTLYISIENTVFFINFTEKLSNSEDAYLAKMQKNKKNKIIWKHFEILMFNYKNYFFPYHSYHCVLCHWLSKKINIQKKSLMTNNFK